MNLTKVDRFLAEEIMGYLNLNWINYYDGMSNREFEFTPTINVKDAFKIINKLQNEWSWSIQMNNLDCEVEVRFGTGYYSHPRVSTAICIAILKHFKVDLAQFDSINHDI